MLLTIMLEALGDAEVSRVGAKGITGHMCEGKIIRCGRGGSPGWPQGRRGVSPAPGRVSLRYFHVDVVHI